MPSAYLKPADYITFGAPNTSPLQVAQASILIDAWLRRPAGLVYVPDANGNPAYMAAMSPALALASKSAFGPGNGLTVGITGPLAMVQVGDCVVLDRANPATAEAVQVTSMDTVAMTMTLGSTSASQSIGVQFAHASGCTIETGLHITEKRYVPKGRSQVVLASTPVARVIGGTGRYGYGRRADSAISQMDDFNLLASVSHFGGPPAWEIWPANTAAGINPSTGELWIPAGIMLAYYSEVMVRYVAGFTYATLPAEIKLACAQLIFNLANNPVMGNVKSMKAGDSAVTQFAATVISDDIKALLAPWRARLFA